MAFKTAKFDDKGAVVLLMLSCGVGLGLTKGRGLGPWHKKRPNTGYKLLWPVLFLEKRVGVVPWNLVQCP